MARFCKYPDCDFIACGGTGGGRLQDTLAKLPKHTFEPHPNHPNLCAKCGQGSSFPRHQPN